MYSISALVFELAEGGGRVEISFEPVCMILLLNAYNFKQEFKDIVGKEA